MALTYHFVTVPELPPQLRHQSGTVEVGPYLVAEGQVVEADTPVMRVQNWWAEMEILAGIRGILVRSIFEPRICRGGQIKPGDPIALLACDAEDSASVLPDDARLRVTRQRHERN